MTFWAKAPIVKTCTFYFSVVAHSIIQGNMLIDFFEKDFVGNYVFKKPTIVFDTQCVSAEYNRIFLLKKRPWFSCYVKALRGRLYMNWAHTWLLIVGPIFPFPRALPYTNCFSNSINPIFKEPFIVVTNTFGELQHSVQYPCVSQCCFCWKYPKVDKHHKSQDMGGEWMHILKERLLAHNKVASLNTRHWKLLRMSRLSC